MDETRSQLMITVRLTGDLAERAEAAAARLFHGNEAMLTRDALAVYLDIRDAQGLRFDMVVQPLRERELAEMAS